MLSLRAATPDDISIVAREVARQPLLVRYGTGPESLARNLHSAIERGDRLLVCESLFSLCGMAWFLTNGTFALGGYLKLISVFPGHERSGVGAALLGEVESITSRDSRFLFLLCDSQNTAARAFYEKHGYSEAGQLADLVKPGIDEVILWKRLAT